MRERILLGGCVLLVQAKKDINGFVDTLRKILGGEMYPGEEIYKIG